MKTIKQQIKQFKEETGYDLEIKDGKPHYDGYLDLQGTQITDTSMVKRNVPEIIELTKSEYQSETFKQFFNK